MANASNITTNTNTNRWLLDSTGASLGDYRSYVNHNGRKRYFSSTDAKLYFGKTEMEEIYQNSKLPEHIDPNVLNEILINIRKMQLKIKWSNFGHFIFYIIIRKYAYING